MKLEVAGLGIARGMALTFKHLFRRPITTQYPEQKLQVSRRSRGQDFVWVIDRCTGCATCAKSCPHGIIEIVTRIGENNQYFVEKLNFDLGRCMYCGLCVESCPFTALYMARDYEKGKYRFGDIGCDRDALKAPGKDMSAYGHSEHEAEKPEQELLVYREEYGWKW